MARAPQPIIDRAAEADNFFFYPDSTSMIHTTDQGQGPTHLLRALETFCEFLEKKCGAQKAQIVMHPKVLAEVTGVLDEMIIRSGAVPGERMPHIAEGIRRQPERYHIAQGSDMAYFKQHLREAIRVHLDMSPFNTDRMHQSVLQVAQKIAAQAEQDVPKSAGDLDNICVLQAWFLEPSMRSRIYAVPSELSFLKEHGSLAQLFDKGFIRPEMLEGLSVRSQAVMAFANARVSAAEEDLLYHIDTHNAPPDMHVIISQDKGLAKLEVNSDIHYITPRTLRSTMIATRCDHPGGSSRFLVSDSGGAERKDNRFEDHLLATPDRGIVAGAFSPAMLQYIQRREHRTGHGG